MKWFRRTGSKTIGGGQIALGHNRGEKNTTWREDDPKSQSLRSGATDGAGYRRSRRDDIDGEHGDSHDQLGVSSRLTRLGWHFLFVATFAVLGGSIRSLNLMLILSGLVFSGLLMSWRVASRSTQRARVRRRLPTEVMAGKPFQIRYLWTNSAWLTPIWLLRVNDSFVPAVRRPLKSTLAGDESTTTRVTRASVERLSRLTTQWLGGKGRVKIKCGIGVVPSTTAVSSIVIATIRRRGVYRFSKLSISTKFPLCLVESRRRSDQSKSLFVYPQALALRKDWRRRLRVQSGGASQSAHKGGQEEGEFYGIRGWQHGDSPRWIHWRTTARLTEPAVRQFQKFRKPDLCIILDAYQVDAAESEADFLAAENFELAVSLAATLTTKMSVHSGDAATLAIASSHAQWVTETRGRIGYQNFMRQLTEVQPTEDPQISALVQQFVHSAHRPRELLVISTRSREHAFLTSPMLIRALSPWMRRSKIKWIQVPDDLDLFVDRAAMRPRSGAASRLSATSVSGRGNEASEKVIPAQKNDPEVADV